MTKKAKKPKTFRRGVLTGVLCSLLVMALILGGLVFALRGSLSTLADLNLSKLQYISTLVPTFLSITNINYRYIHIWLW